MMMLQSAEEKEKRFFIAVDRKLNSGWKRNGRLEIFLHKTKALSDN